MEEQVVSKEITCPGCHFECVLVEYQCGRGKEFYDIAAAGGEVPIRRGPMMTPSEKAARPEGKPPVNHRVMHMLNVAANRLQDRHVEAGDRKVVLTLDRAKSFMSVPIMAKRMLVSPEETEKALEEAKAAGYVTVADEERGRMAYLTDAGKQQAAAWNAEHEARTAEFLSALSEDEKETLDELMRKLLGIRPY